MTNKSKCLSGSFLSGGHSGRHHRLCSFKIALRVINTHGCTVVYPCYLGFCLLKMYPYKDITSILCTDVLYTVHKTSVCWYHYCSLAFTVESIKLIITEFVKSDKPKACSGFNVSAVETPESPQSVLSNKIYMYETY